MILTSFMLSTCFALQESSIEKSADQVYAELLARHRQAQGIEIRARGTTTNTVHYPSGARSSIQTWDVQNTSSVDHLGHYVYRDLGNEAEYEFFGNGEHFYKIDREQKTAELAGSEFGWFLSSFEFNKSFWKDRYILFEPEKVEFLPVEKERLGQQGLRVTYSMKPSGTIGKDGYLSFEEQPNAEALERGTVQIIETLWLDANGLPTYASVQRDQKFGGPQTQDADNDAPLTMHWELQFDHYRLLNQVEKENFQTLPEEFEIQ